MFITLKKFSRDGRNSCKMLSLIEYLKEPSLVAQIQKQFGIKDKVTSGTKNAYRSSLQKVQSPSSQDDSCKSSKTIGRAPANDSSKPSEDYVIENKFWYYLFLIGTSLGDEIFYASFIPFWFWNIDGAVGRRIVSVWTIIMYIGQGIKDIIKWPRPTYPAKRLQKKWSEEYGMPSTHAMVAVSIPFSVIFYTFNRYIYSLSLGISISTIWCAVICVSRVYFGMHTVLDIIVGLFLASVLMIPMVPIVDYLDYFWISSPVSPIILLLISVAVIYFFPHSGEWTPTRGDTTMITSVCTGIHIGAWMNYILGNMSPYPYPPPYKIIWPDSYMLGLGVLRTILGFSLVLATRNITKLCVTNVLSLLLHTTPARVKEKNNDKTKKDVFIELANNFCTYFLVGFNTVYSIPILFRFLGIERPTFYTEM